MKKIIFTFLFFIICLSACNGKTPTKVKSSKHQTLSYMASSEKIEYIISEEVALNYLSNVITNDRMLYYGKTDFGASSIKIIDVSIENNKARIYVQFLYSGYSFKDDFFLRQASSNEQVAVIDITTIDNGDNTLELTDSKVVKISKNDNEYQEIVKDYFPQKKYLEVLKNRTLSLQELQSMENLSVEDYLSSQNKQGMPYGDFEKYFAYTKY
jgi:hypothetical protein